MSAETSNVVALHRVASLPGADTDIIEHLRCLLERAEKGEIRAFAFAYVNGAGAACADWHQGKAQLTTLIAAVARTQFLMHRSWAENDTDS